jgi:hypothetical protein
MKTLTLTLLAIVLPACGGMMSNIRSGWAKDASTFEIDGCAHPAVLGEPELFGGSSFHGAHGMRWKVDCDGAVYNCRGQFTKDADGTNPRIGNAKCIKSD